MSAKDDKTQQMQTQIYPQVRIKTFGEFTVERLIDIPQRGCRKPRYESFTWEYLHSRGTAIAMLKVLLCCPQRRATKQELIAELWPQKSPRQSTHMLDVAASVLRRQILHTANGKSLLITQRRNSETSFTLPEQAELWIDADAFLHIANAVLAMETHGHNPRLLLEKAYTMVSGEFLEDNLRDSWSQKRRQTIRGTRSRILYHLVDLYQHEHCPRQAEALLYVYLEGFPTDEDALCRLLTLLIAQGRWHEALDMYRYTCTALGEEQREPSPYTQALIKSFREQRIIREHTLAYQVPRLYVLSTTA
ncbi:MAG TPA: BTAD domain-containing putative transcriptional regulator [Dictyobacter sp.]|nr:BTAD domain-containing putative transcriptional regulator [Dictyobacter sp.]